MTQGLRVGRAETKNRSGRCSEVERREAIARERADQQVALLTSAAMLVTSTAAERAGRSRSYDEEYRVPWEIALDKRGAGRSPNRRSTAWAQHPPTA